MKVIIAGCGKVGKAIVESMANEGHNVVAVDTDQSVIDDITNTYDVMAVCGSGTSRDMLVQAGVKNADLFISATEQDEVNMIACYLAKKMGAKQTVARIRQTDYNDDINYIVNQFGLSMALNPEQLTAETLLDQLKLPSAIKVENFAGKKIQLLELNVKSDSPLCNQSLGTLRKEMPVRFLACAIQRDEEVVIPTGQHILSEGDKVALMVKRTDTHKLLKALGLVQKQSHDVLIMGASNIAYYLSRMLIANNYSVKIIERDEARCQEIAEKLPSASIICGDGTSQDLLCEEGLQNTSSFVALTGKDEENVLISFYALTQQVPKVIAKVSHSDLFFLTEKLGLNCVVSPQKIVADVLTRYARALENSSESKVQTMYSLMDGRAEALEFEVLPDCTLVDKSLKDLQLKPNFIVAGILRGKETIIPTGDDVIQLNDRVIVVASDEHLYDLSDIVK